MRLVIDTNQISEIRRTKVLTPSQKKRITLVLPPLVWAEGVQYQNGRGLRCLLEYNLRFGRDVSDVLSDAATGTDAQLRQVDSLVRKGSTGHRNCLRDLMSCSPERLLRAREIKDDNLADMDHYDGLFRVACKQGCEAKPRGQGIQLIENVCSLEAVIAELGNRLNTPFRAPDDSAPARTTLELLMSGNVRLVNFVRFHLCLILARTGVWKNPKLNFAGPCGKRDDIPDMVLPLYAAEGDVIVTADAKFRRLFAMVDRMEQIRVMTWHECVTMLRKA